MKKVLNITMMQRILKPSLLAFLIAGSGFLPNASAVRWTVDFENKEGGGHIEASDLAGYVTILNTSGNFIKNVPLVLNIESITRTQTLFEKSKETGVKHEQMNRSDPGSTIVLKNGILDVQEAKKLLNGVRNSFNIEFINCSGTLDLNKDLKDHAISIKFQDCDFKTAPDCFKGAKRLEFRHTNLTPMNGQIGIDKSTFVAADKKSFIFLQNILLLNAIVLEKRGNQPQNETTTNSAMEMIAHTEYIGKQFSSLQTRYNLLNGELEEIKRNNKGGAQYKLKVTELEEQAQIKDLLIRDLRTNIQGLEKEKESMRKELRETIQSRNEEQEALSSLRETTRTQLEDAERNNKMYKANIKEMKDRNAQLKKNNEKLLKDQKCTKSCIKDLEASKSELEAINEKLEADNNALREEIRKSSETVRTAKETLKKFKDLQERNERLLEASHNKSDKIGSLTKNIGEKDRRIRELEALLGIAGSFINNIHPLLRDLKKNDEYIRNALFNAGYDEEVKKFNQSLGKLYEAGKERKKQHKKCDWIDFDFEEPFSVLDDDDNDETYLENKTMYRGRGSFYGRGYRGRGKYFRGNYRGRGNGQMRINNPRGGKRGGEQRDSFDSDNH